MHLINTKQNPPTRYPVGCLSDISVPPTLGKTYFDAVNSYFELCAMYPSALPVFDPNIAHSYSVTECSVTEVGVDDYSVHDLSAYASESFDSAAIGDDDVEACGYLGWLRPC